jgi:hypothetical protein
MKKFIGVSIALTSVTLALATGVTSGAQAAGSGSVPLPPPGMVFPPGGGTPILTVQPITPGQPLVVTGTVDGVQYTITIPATTFQNSTDPLELVVTSCSLQSIGNAGFNGYTAYACIGAYVVDEVTGQTVPGPFSPAFSMTLVGSAIEPSTQNIFAIFNPNNSSWSQISGNTTGSAQASITNDSYFALLVQNTTPVSTIPNATPQTGKPFLGEEVGAGILLGAGLIGVGFLFYARRRRNDD